MRLHRVASRTLAALLIPTAGLFAALIGVAGLVLIIGEAPGAALCTLVRGVRRI
ncbi:MAG: hypothetical protein JO139_07725 [Alphaproteobacteria bacterium]|nr:hypothetical protein [Alphaproteobacteria bacterium]